jgi:hypothetical protein
MAVSCGAVLLAIVLWKEDAAETAASAVVAASGSDAAVQG